MNILLLLAHAIEEYDQLRLLSGLGYDVFSLGGYIDPRSPHEDKRPALPAVPFHPELKKVVDELGTPDNLRAAKEHIPDALIEWADVIIVHHYEHTWLLPQWDRIRHKRVIWRTVGQSVEHNERLMAPLRSQGLEIVRYSPRERSIPGFAGEDALIRFYKDPDDWQGWTGEDAVVGNVTQHMADRAEYCGLGFWLAATAGLPAKPAGPGSERLPGGIGALGFDEMREYLRRCRAYLYTGTQPASYTLGLIEAMMTGVPVVSIGPEHMQIFPYGHLMFEGYELVNVANPDSAFDRMLRAAADPPGATKLLRLLLNEPASAALLGGLVRARAIELFGRETIARQWLAYLGYPGRSEFSFARESVTA